MTNVPSLIAMGPRRGVRQDQAAWDTGYRDGIDGIGGLRPRCPDGFDLLSYWTGYIEGKAQRLNLSAGHAG
jgi:hypothetical protein